MSNRLLKLSERIQSEVIDLESVIDRIKEGWQRSKKSGDNYYIDSVALNLHGFYSGLERIFESIASSVDSRKPTDKEWHKALLYQMAQEVPQSSCPGHLNSPPFYNFQLFLGLCVFKIYDKIFDVKYKEAVPILFRYHECLTPLRQPTVQTHQHLACLQRSYV